MTMKKFKLLLLVCLIPLAGIAQETPEAVKAKIKEVKLSEKYVYAETTSTQSLAEAQQNAIDLLRRHVLNVLTEKEGDPKQAEKVWDELGKQYERLTVSADSLFRVFVYIPKDRLLATKVTDTMPATPIVQAEKVSAATPTSGLSEEDFLFEAPKEEDTQMDEATLLRFFGQMEMVESKPQKINSEVAEKAATPVETPQLKQMALVEATPVEATPVEATPVEATPVEAVPIEATVVPVEATPVEAAPAEVAPVAPAPLRKELQDMLAMKTYKEALVYLNRQKEEGRAIYGRIKTMTAPAKSYLLVVRNGEMVTILDKGASVRTNLKTNLEEPVKNYLGYGVIWFQLF